MAKSRRPGTSERTSRSSHLGHALARGTKKSLRSINVARRHRANHASVHNRRPHPPRVIQYNVGSLLRAIGPQVHDLGRNPAWENRSQHVRDYMKHAIVAPNQMVPGAMHVVVAVCVDNLPALRTPQGGRDAQEDHAEPKASLKRAAARDPSSRGNAVVHQAWQRLQPSRGGVAAATKEPREGASIRGIPNQTIPIGPHDSRGKAPLRM